MASWGGLVEVRKPKTISNVIGASSCGILMNEHQAILIIDTGSVISLISSHLVHKYHIPCSGWDPRC